MEAGANLKGSLGTFLNNETVLYRDLSGGYIINVPITAYKAVY